MLEPALLKQLQSYDTPTICNALEVVAPERRLTGFTVRPLVCPFPALAPIVGYARTATIRASCAPPLPAAEMKAKRVAYYEYVAEGGPAPAIQAINLWVRDQSPNWRLGLQLANLDLALLLGHQLQRNSGGRLRLISVIADAENLPAARHYLRRMRDEARLDASTEIVVEEGNFAALQARAPAAEVSILGIPETIDLAALTAIQRGIGSTCLFVHDSSLESALA